MALLQSVLSCKFRTAMCQSFPLGELPSFRTEGVLMYSLLLPPPFLTAVPYFIFIYLRCCIYFLSPLFVSLFTFILYLFLLDA